MRYPQGLITIAEGGSNCRIYRSQTENLKKPGISPLIMKKELQERLFSAGTILYGARSKKSGNGLVIWNFQCQDYMFDILLKLTQNIESYNHRFPQRKVRAFEVKMEEGRLVFQTHRKNQSIEQLIAAARYEVKLLRAKQKQSLLIRAKNIHTTALFGSKLLADWKHMMSDDIKTGRRILEYAERVAINPGDWEMLNGWYCKYLHDYNAAERCLQRAKIKE